MTSQIQPPGQRHFYGWFAMAGVVVAQFIGSGTYILSFGVFLPVMCDDLGWSRGITSIALSLGILCFGVPSLLWGYLTDRFGPRKTIIWGNVLLSLGMGGMFFVQEAWQAYVLYCLAGLGSGIGGYVPAAVITNNWFVKKRSVAMGLLAASPGLGGFVFPTLIALMIEDIGWRPSWLVLAAIVLVGASLVGGALLIRSRPEDIGQYPDGVPPATDSQPATEEATGEALKSISGWTLGQALRNPVFLLIAVYVSAYCYTYFSISAHQVSHVIDLGYDNVLAASTFSVVSGLSILGSLLFGFAAMKISVNRLAPISIAVMISTLVMLMLTDSLPVVFVYAVIFGLSNGSLTPVAPTIVGNYYGRAHYGKIIGATAAIQMTMAAIGVTVAGTIRDATGSYTTAFIIMIGMLAAGLITISLARPPKLPGGGN